MVSALVQKLTSNAEHGLEGDGHGRLDERRVGEAGDEATPSAVNENETTTARMNPLNTIGNPATANPARLGSSPDQGATSVTGIVLVEVAGFSVNQTDVDRLPAAG
jgi:hypothetical protein